ncbi:MAG TPA: transporter substrate-binding domain-containing protein [Candidatus Ozemobacteraceae bacterium]|nr:transporter substrate-binding domain-containing protein [Candidatus Ozemobacteraceae bacterium]
MTHTASRPGRFFRPLLVVLVVAFVCVSLSPSFSLPTVILTPEEQAWIAARGNVIRLAPDPAFPPLEWFDERGEYRGFVADCIRQIEARLGIRIEIVRCRTWDEVIARAKSRRIDGITAAQITPERLTYLAFTRPLVDIPNVIITRADIPGTLDFGRMEGMSIAVTRGNALHEHIRERFPGLRLVPQDDDLACLQAVSFNHADTAVVNFAIASWLIDKHGIARLRVAGDSGKTNVLAIACRNDQPLLHAILEKGLASLSAEEKSVLYKRWISLENPSGFSEEFWRWFGYVAMVLTAIMTGFVIWNRTLHSLVAIRTDELTVELSARREAEKALLDQKERLAVTLACIGEGVISTDLSGRILIMNATAADLTGWKPEEAAGKVLSEVFPIRTGTSGHRQRSEMTDRRGRRLRISSAMAPITDAGGSQIGTVIVFQDITVQEEIERELQRAQKLESLGILAGGIAHDFNNILTGILGNVSLAKALLPSGTDAFRFLAEAESSISTARGLTRQLLTFARGGLPHKRAQAVTHLIEDAAKLVMAGSSIRLLLDIAPDLHMLEVDEGQFGQAIQNLVINARQAMPSGGTIRVSAHNVTVAQDGTAPEGQSVMRPGQLLEPGSYVRLSVVDEGCGILPENLPHLFDPFFTTKSTGHGLGLSTVYSIIERHGGHITVESRPGEGSTFHIYLPATARQPLPQEEAAPLPAGGVGTILVMDDEQAILSVMQGILSHLGFESTGVPNGEAAIEACRQAIEANRPYRLAILDLTIRGGMGGNEARKRLHELDPNLKFVVASGYSNDPILADHASHGFCGSLRKPFTMADVQAVLGRIRETPKEAA